MTRIIEIEGIGDAFAKKLEAAGITTVEGLLKDGATPAGRKSLAEKTAISDKLILKWVNHADLFRINGVGGQYAELLEAAGVDTVMELSQRKAANLYAKLVEVNAAKNIANATPGESQVAKWVEEAKTLPRAVNY
jgi:predicted flap endonuclease-1-like 5' DNA nuclease